MCYRRAARYTRRCPRFSTRGHRPRHPRHRTELPRSSLYGDTIRTARVEIVVGGMPVRVIRAVVNLHVGARQRADDFAATEVADRDGGTELLGEYLLRGSVLRHERREPDEERVAVGVIGVLYQRRCTRRMAAIAVTRHRSNDHERHERRVLLAAPHEVYSWP